MLSEKKNSVEKLQRFIRDEKSQNQISDEWLHMRTFILFHAVNPNNNQFLWCDIKFVVNIRSMALFAMGEVKSFIH